MAGIAVRKANQAIGAIIRPLATSKATYWDAHIKLYNSTVLNTLFYGCFIRGLRYLKGYKCVFTSNFYKKYARWFGETGNFVPLAIEVLSLS